MAARLEEDLGNRDERFYKPLCLLCAADTLAGPREERK